jgi:hypothetical protein
LNNNIKTITTNNERWDVLASPFYHFFPRLRVVKEDSETSMEEAMQKALADLQADLGSRGNRGDASLVAAGHSG